MANEVMDRKVRWATALEEGRVVAVADGDKRVCDTKADADALIALTPDAYVVDAREPQKKPPKSDKVKAQSE